MKRKGTKKETTAELLRRHYAPMIDHYLGLLEKQRDQINEMLRKAAKAAREKKKRSR